MDKNLEWLEVNTHGAFSYGTVSRAPQRKYNSLFTLRDVSLDEGINTILDFSEFIENPTESYGLSPIDMKGHRPFISATKFQAYPVPEWTYVLPNNQGQLKRSIQWHPTLDVVCLKYQITGFSPDTSFPIRLRLDPLFLFRPIHKLTQENIALFGGVEKSANAYFFKPYGSIPGVGISVSGAAAFYKQAGRWIKNCSYEMEHLRGYPYVEDVYVPGSFYVNINKDTEFFIFLQKEGVKNFAEKDFKFTSAESKIINFKTILDQAAKQFIVSTKDGFSSIIAGYPWFSHWGRDTFISLPGLVDDAPTTQKIFESYMEILLHQFAKKKNSDSVLKPSDLNCTGSDTPFLFSWALHHAEEKFPENKKVWQAFYVQIADILEGIESGTNLEKLAISSETGLLILKAGPWTHSWMDVFWDGWPVTPRTIYAVDIEALYLFSLMKTLQWAKSGNPVFYKKWNPIFETGKKHFQKLFWLEEKGFFADSHDGTQAIAECRPNQLWALALPMDLVTPEQAKKVLKNVQENLLTPLGLRTLSPDHPSYVGYYEGDLYHRDHAYHQGSIWPWLLGIWADSVEKYLGKKDLKKMAQPILDNLEKHSQNEGCWGQISEIFNGDAPHHCGGAPAQAWSVAETRRVLRKVTNGA